MRQKAWWIMRLYAIAYRDSDSAVQCVISCDGKIFRTTTEAEAAGYEILFR
jgi:hypothetical protein